MYLVIIGCFVKKEVMDVVDFVMEMKFYKYYYDEGIFVVKGIEF